MKSTVIYYVSAATVTIVLCVRPKNTIINMRLLQITVALLKKITVTIIDSLFSIGTSAIGNLWSAVTNLQQLMNNLKKNRLKIEIDLKNRLQ